MVVTLLALTALVTVNLVNGKAGGIAAYGGFGRPVTWLVTLVLFAALLAAAGFLIKKRVDGIFIDERNRISLSRVQLVLWTLLLVGALFTAALSNFSIGWPTPLQITVPPSVWALLGIGSFSFVAAPAILNRLKAQGAAPTRLATIEARLRAADRFTGSVTATGPVVEKPTPQDARWADVIRGDTNDADYVDVAKVQQLAFTVLLIVVYGAALFAALAAVGAGGVPKELTEFPAVDGGFVSLLGLSHAAYLASKAVPKP